VHDVVEFLGRHAPFDELGERRLQELSNLVEVEYFPAGATIISQDESPPQHAWVIRRGAVELRDRDRILDLLAEGELFGHPSMLSGHPPGLEVRAHEDSLCYRLPTEALLRSPTPAAGPPHASRSLNARPVRDLGALPVGLHSAGQTAASLVRREPTVVEPDAPLRVIAERMGGADGSVLVALGEGRWGIVTGSDLRRAISDGIPVDAPVSEVMSEELFSVEPERLGAEVMLEMLDRGIHHVPVVAPPGELIGLLTDIDLLAAQTSTPFAIRRAIAAATSSEQLRGAADDLWPAVVSLHDARVDATQISAITAIVVDSLIGRLIEVSVEQAGEPPCPFSWLTLGSYGRREPAPSSDVDSALAWDEGDDEEPEAEAYMSALGERVSRELAECGFVADSHGVTASRAHFVRSLEGWRRQLRDSIEDPHAEEGLIMISLFLDGRAGYRRGAVGDLYEELRSARHRGGLVTLMLRDALMHRPPTGFLRDFVLVHSGEHSGELDIKHGGLLPVSSIARYASLSAGEIGAGTTRERLSVAAASGTLKEQTAGILAEAFDLFGGLRLDHQVEQIRRGERPDDLLDPRQLSSLTRRYLRDAFGEVRSVQRELASGLVPKSLFG